ncbi:MAG: YadA-like family protein [Acidaminococcaceae bacterium]|nr:YadA-like family protein [Acidaminococcaceae bacterium]
MNKIYKVIWSQTKNCYVVASELTKSHTKSNGARTARNVMARVFCGALLGTLLAGGVYMPAAQAAVVTGDSINVGYYADGSSISTGSSAYGSIASGWANGANSTISTGEGAVGSIASGYAVYGGKISTGDNADGSTASGYAGTNGKISTGEGAVGSIASGYVRATSTNNTISTGKNAYGSVAMGYADAYGVNSTISTGEKAYGSSAAGYAEDGGTISIGNKAYGSIASGYANGANSTISIGENAYGSVAMGYAGDGGNVTANGKGSVAIGHKVTAGADYTVALGDGSQASGVNSLALLGGVTETAATNSAAIGNGAKAKVADTVALGSGSVASRTAGATDAYLKGDNTGAAWVSTNNAIAVGDDATVTRQITGVAAGTEDTDAVNVAQLKAAATGGGTAYTAGDGIAINDTTKAISVNANADDFEFATTDKKLQIKKNGAVETGNTGIVTGGTVFTETRVTSDGNYITAANSAAQNLTTLDTQVKTNTDAIAGKADKATSLSGYGITDAYTITAADAKFAMLDASNIDAATWGAKLGTGTISSSSENLVTGKTVYTEVRPASNGTYVKTTNTTAANLTALDTQVKANADALEGKASATAVTTLEGKVAANETAIALKANAADVYTKTETESTFAKKSDVYTKTETDTKLNTKADKDSVYTKSEMDTQLSAKADATNVYTKTETDTKLDAKADKTALSAVETTANTAKSTADAAKTAADSATATANAAKAAVDTIADTDKINALVTDVDTLKANEGGEVAAPGEENANKNVAGEKVYNYLNGESLALGGNSNAIAIGKGSQATGPQSIAIGFGNKVSGAGSGAFGDPNTITGTGSYAVGNNNTIGGNNTFVLGNNVTANVDNAVVLGNNSTAEAHAVSVGSAGGERQIKHLKAGQDDTDAVNVGQMNAAIDHAVGNNMVNMSNQINKLDNRINKVGAGAAALAALHPIDTDDKFTMGLGYGNYRSAHSAAVGMFYRPTDKIMLSMGGAFGNGENMVNAGISFALDKGKGFGTSKAAMARKINSLTEENAEMKEKLAAQGSEIEMLKEALARLEAKVGKQG